MTDEIKIPEENIFTCEIKTPVTGEKQVGTFKKVDMKFTPNDPKGVYVDFKNIENFRRCLIRLL